MKINPFRQEGLISRLCRQSGGRWIVTATEADVHYVRDSGPAAVRFLLVRFREGTHWIKFSSEFPVKFPLTGTPAGIFARLLLRSVTLRYSHWSMDLRDSCEGLPFVVAQWPLSIMSPSVFDATCNEIDREIRDFHQELRDRFHGDLGRPAPPAGYPPDDDIRFLGPVVSRQPAQPARRMLGR